MYNILVVDDDPKIRELLAANLKARNHIVNVAADGSEAIQHIKAGSLDLILLDLVMPGISGIDVITWARAQSDLPIVVISAYEEEQLMVEALDAGADDYVNKPFDLDVLLARVRAVMRRASEGNKPVRQHIALEDLLLNLEDRQVSIEGVPIRLTRTEFALLRELALNLDRTLTHQELLARVWGPQYRNESHYLYIYFGRIREKLGPKYGGYLETVPGMGYVLRSSI